MKKLLLLLLALTFWTTTQAQFAPPVLEVYHGAECPHCHKELKWLEGVQKEHPELKVELYEVWHDRANAAIWQKRVSDLGETATGVPTNVIGDQVIVGFNPEAIEKALGIYNPEAPKPETKDENWWQKYLTYSWPAMSLVLGLIDGFNPCAMWTLFMLISLLLVIEDKKKRWLIGGVFLATSGIIYGAALLTYLFGFKAITTLLATQAIDWLFRLVGVMAVVTGLITLYKAPKAGIDCSIRDAESKRNFHQKLQNILLKENFWLVLVGIAGLAISVNAIELLCSFAIPTTFTATLISLELPLYQQLIAVGLYDLMYMLDDLIVFAIAMYTLNLKVFSPKITKVTHIIGGVILLILGALLLFNPSFLSAL